MTAKQTSLVRVDPERPDPSVVGRAADILRRGGLVAFPTETVYGLGANARDPDAVRKIFAAKERPTSDPLIVHVLDTEAARAVTAEWPETAQRLAAAFWPGPLTLVLPKHGDIPEIVTAGLDTVAVRVPSHPVARAILAAAGVPIAAPSANRFTELSPTRAEHVARALGGRVDLIVDAGPTPVGIESTVVDLRGPLPVVLRPGTISAPALAAVIGPLGAIAGGPSGDDTAPRRSPGMRERHYAPQAQVYLFDASTRDEAARLGRVRDAAGGTVGALLLSDIDSTVRHRIAMPDDPALYARALYAALHTLDERGCDLVLIELTPDTPAWTGIRDRLTRAARGGS
ncbi:MAG TPA: L-threonylcarbamoyladenylate synthase [Gemmatimonadaceae bacterium]